MLPNLATLRQIGDFGHASGAEFFHWRLAIYWLLSMFSMEKLIKVNFLLKILYFAICNDVLTEKLLALKGEGTFTRTEKSIESAESRCARKTRVINVGPQALRALGLNVEVSELL